MSELAIMDKENFASIAKDMGMLADVSAGKKSSLARLKLDHKGVEGTTSIKGKSKTVLVVDPGMYCLDLPDGSKVYDSNPTIRLYNQRFCYKKYVQADNTYVKTIMELNLKKDLPDTDGGYNCGKPAGWVEDYDSLDQATKDLMKSIKRVRVFFGVVTFNDPYNDKGDEVDKVEVPFIWEIDNREAFKHMGTPVKTMAGMGHILPQHTLTLGSDEKIISNTIRYFVPTYEFNEKVLDLTKEDQEIFNNFNDWITDYNSWVSKTHNDNRGGANGASPEVIEAPKDPTPKPTVRSSKKVEEKSKPSLETVVDEFFDD